MATSNSTRSQRIRLVSMFVIFTSWLVFLASLALTSGKQPRDPQVSLAPASVETGTPSPPGSSD